MRKLKRGHPFRFARLDRRYHSDGPRLIRGGTTAAFFMVGGHGLEESLTLIEGVRREVDSRPEEFLLVKRAADVLRAKRTGRLGVILSWESGLALGENLDVLGCAHRLGVRASTLTHGEGGRRFALQGTRSPVRYATPRQRDLLRRRARGLTGFGREAVKEMNRLGVLVDLAHANDATTDEVLRLTTRPVVSTHGGVYACCPHTRCSTDRQIRDIAATGGLVSASFYSAFLVRRPARATVEHIVDQVAHIAELVGVEHAGVGSDFDGLAEKEIPVIRSAERLPRLTEALVRRGFSDSEIGEILGGNYLRVMREVMG
jgi:membrane dipeptidase